MQEEHARPGTQVPASSDSADQDRADEVPVVSTHVLVPSSPRHPSVPLCPRQGPHPPTFPQLPILYLPIARRAFRQRSTASRGG